MVFCNEAIGNGESQRALYGKLFYPGAFLPSAQMEMILVDLSMLPSGFGVSRHDACGSAF